MKILAKIRDKCGKVVTIIRYQKSLEGKVVGLFHEGYPNSFDGVDLRAIKTLTKENDGTFLLAFCGEKIVSCLTGFRRVKGCHNLYMTGYRYTIIEFRNRRIATIIQGIAEEILKDKARLIVTTNAGILPEDDQSIGWFKNVGFVFVGEVKGWFRDDLSGVFLGKRNPYFPIGKGIPKNSGWCPESVVSRTGGRISEKEYQEVLNDPGLVSKEKWGLDLIDRENILEWSL